MCENFKKSVCEKVEQKLNDELFVVIIIENHTKPYVSTKVFGVFNNKKKATESVQSFVEELLDSFIDPSYWVHDDSMVKIYPDLLCVLRNEHTSFKTKFYKFELVCKRMNQTLSHSDLKQY